MGYNINMKARVDFFTKGELIPRRPAAGNHNIAMCDKTMTFSVNQEKETELKRNLTIIYDALMQKGYNPINQIGL